MGTVLYVGNRNYSSWSMRPWLALRWAGITFETRMVELGGPGYGSRQVPGVLEVSASGTVPVLHVDDDVIGDSLAICEWAAESHPELWPRDRIARAMARSAACEMHSSFVTLRRSLPCNVRRRAAPRPLGEELRRDIARIEAIWGALRARFGGAGPYLFGERPTVADAFFTPVATRFRSYAVSLRAESQSYADALLANSAFKEWEREAEAEAHTMPHADQI